jgi:hypothetical protein
VALWNRNFRRRYKLEDKNKTPTLDWLKQGRLKKKGNSSIK